MCYGSGGPLATCLPDSWETKGNLHHPPLDAVVLQQPLALSSALCHGL